MEDIIHYKFVNESLSQDRETIVTGIDLPWFNDELAKPSLKESSSIFQSVTITEDEFKKAMSNNEQVGVFRETIIVSENLEKNTISLKKYLFSKQFVNVKELKQRKFKIIRRESYSLTINKTSGDFSMYNKKKHKKRDIIFIRKNISNGNVKNRIQSLLSDGDSKNETNNAIGVFYQLLGYGTHMLSYTSIIGLFFNEDPKDKEHKHSLIIFPFLNYIFKNKINIYSYYLLYPFESIFQKNKKHYKGGNIENYITDHYKINNKDLISSLLPILVNNNQNIVINKFNIGSSAGFVADRRYEFDTINPLILKILDYYNITINELPSVNLKDVFTNVGQENQVYIPTYFFEILKLYNFKLDDVLANKDNMFYTMNELYTFYQFGDKLKISSLTEIKENKDNIFDKIFDALCIARNVTGTFSINDKFIKRVNRFIPKKVKISLNYGKKITTRSRSFSERHGISSECESGYNRLFSNSNETMIIPMTFIDNNDPIKYTLMFNKNYHQSFCRRNNNLNITNDKYGKLVNALNFNKNGILDTLEIKQIYSKQYFENACKEEFKINPSLWVDYIR